MFHDLDFADLKHSYQRRTYNFEEYKKRLGLSNPRLLNWIGSIVNTIGRVGIAHLIILRNIKRD